MSSANAVHGKKGSVAPFDMAQDSMTFSADQSTRFQGRFTDQKQAEREQARLRKEIEDMEEANRQQEQQIAEMEQMNAVLEKKVKSNDLTTNNEGPTTAGGPTGRPLSQ